MIQVLEPWKMWWKKLRGGDVEETEKDVRGCMDQCQSVYCGLPWV